jgi:general stress protein YciG
MSNLSDETLRAAMREMGHRGGTKNRDARLAEDPEHFAKIGAKGGAKTAARGREFYQEIGRKGGSARRAKANAST